MTVHPLPALELEPLTLPVAEQLISQQALRPSTIGSVGLEVESQLVDLSRPAERVAWERVQAMRPDIEAAAGRSPVTFEPGGQVELSGPPMGGVLDAVEAMRLDVQRVRLALTEHGSGLALVGSDPLRPAVRVNPRARYRAMARHFAAVGRARAGATMMCATAALQVNLDAGPESGWADRVALAQQLGPTLSALAACSPWLSGHPTGRVSARGHAWAELGARPTVGADPVREWVHLALAAPVMFTAVGDALVPVERAIAFGRWVTGEVRLGDRRPTSADLITHLSTLFPPVRLRGYLELRYLDVSPPRWWPAVAAVTTVLLDDPVAADAAREIVQPVADLWSVAANAGLRDARLAAAAEACLHIAVARVPAALRTAVEDLAELVASGRSPGDLLAERIAEVGPLAAFEELAHA